MSMCRPAVRVSQRCLRQNPELPCLRRYSSITAFRLRPSTSPATTRFYKSAERTSSCISIFPHHSFPRARRRFSTTPSPRHGHINEPKPGEGLNLTIIDQSSQPHKFYVPHGANLLDIAQHHELEMEGACGGSCACSTCHVIVEDQAYYDRMPEPGDDENDMLDLAFGLTETSRLGCQVKMEKELDGLVVRLPSMTRNLQKSDFEKKGGG